MRHMRKESKSGDWDLGSAVVRWELGSSAAMFGGCFGTESKDVTGMDATAVNLRQ